MRGKSRTSLIIRKLSIGTILCGLLIAGGNGTALGEKTSPRKKSDSGISAAVPPAIPHEAEPPVKRLNCLDCHQKNSRSDAVETSHPDRINCRQCHVEQNQDVPPFRSNTHSKD